mmetsp:Transcript_2552/g.6883  ORF Transcript_2552/g.6883 Transcript_2552/m.6883 type:complete len:209 (-) Transcript_2552:165-791(-)
MAAALLEWGARLAAVAVDVVVGGERVEDELARAVRVHVARHVVTLVLHVEAHFVEARRRDYVALAVDLPRDGRVLRADLVVARGAGGRARVVRDVLAHRAVDDHAADQVGVVVGIVVDDREDLALHANRGEGVERRERDDVVGAEDAVVERGLVLVGGAASAGGRLGPVDLICLADHHVCAVLPGVLGGELGVVRVVVAALEALADGV